MKAFVLASSLALFASPVLADEVVVTPAPGAVVEHRAADVDVTKEKVITRHSDDCHTKSVTKTNGMGDSVTHTKTNC
jgi:hypothetical protein